MSCAIARIHGTMTLTNFFLEQYCLPWWSSFFQQPWYIMFFLPGWVSSSFKYSRINTFPFLSLVSSGSPHSLCKLSLRHYWHSCTISRFSHSCWGWRTHGDYQVRFFIFKSHTSLTVVSGGIFFALKVPEHGQTTYLSLEVIRPSISGLLDQLIFLVQDSIHICLFHIFRIQSVTITFAPFLTLIFAFTNRRTVEPTRKTLQSTQIIVPCALWSTPGVHSTVFNSVCIRSCKFGGGRQWVVLYN